MRGKLKAGGDVMKKTLFVLVNNEPEVLMRVAGLLRRKGVNIKNISMDEIENSSMACITITFLLKNLRITEIFYNIEKMEDVHKVEEMGNVDVFNRYYQLARGRVDELKLAYNL